MASFATPAELALHLRISLDLDSMQQALDGATGLLRTAAGLTADPVPLPVNLRTWTLELAAMTYDNPTGRVSEEAGEVRAGWPSRRRAEILAEAARTYGAGSASTPQFSFPDAQPWPAW